ncbi:MAG: thiamine transporter ThiT [Candidatus Nanohaloarchaea archaeon]|jgi:thiamine transporter ThiT
MIGNPVNNRNKFLSSIVFLFVAVGFGLGLTVFIGLNLLTDSNIATGGETSIAILSFSLLILSFFIGPAVSAFTGFMTGMKSESSGKAMTTSLFGAFIGFILMMVLALTFGSQAISNELMKQLIGNQNFLSYMIGPVLQASIPTSIVGLVAAIVGFRFSQED